jgi:hypothetical protein
MSKKQQSGPKVLILDIETRPMECYTWGIWDVNVPLNMIKRDWGILSWAAKWLGSPVSEVMYEDLRRSKDIYDDSKLLKRIWQLLDEADIVVGQNSKAFDIKKLNARFLKHKMGPPSPFRQIDTKQIAGKHFALTSKKLEYMSDEFNTTYKKQKHEEFGGFSLWEECLAGNQKAWKAMEKYNIFDVLSTEELFTVFQQWDQAIDFNVYHDKITTVCNCGSSDFMKRGFSYTTSGKFQRFKCVKCSAWTSGKTNLLTKEKKKAMRDKS